MLYRSKQPKQLIHQVIVTIKAIHRLLVLSTITPMPAAVDNDNNTSDGNDVIVNNNNDNNNSLASSSAVVSILHFNDCYNVEPRSVEPSGGAARLVTAFNSFKANNPLVLFSGDIMAPSIMSSFTKGEQMIPVLNALAVDCALFGNHEFDFGVPHLQEFVSRTHFPWVLSNVFDQQTNRPLAGAKPFHIIHRNGKKIGVIGLVEEQWLADAIDYPFKYQDFVSEGKQLVQHLKQNESVDFVIALTHMRWPNDCRLANSVPQIDLILGGHDHDYLSRTVNNILCVKSGTDFRQFSKIDVQFIGPEKYEIKCKEISVNSFDFNEDMAVKEELKKFTFDIESKLDVILADMRSELDGRFAHIRRQETNLGNFVCDIVLAATGADAVLLNSGTFRSDQIHTTGVFKLRDLVRILPMMDALVVLNITGRQLLVALECAVSQWPVLDGSFAHISRIKYAFNPNKLVGNRVDRQSVTIGGQPVDLDKKYKLVTKDFLNKGKDGYYVLKDCDVVLSEDSCTNLFDLVKNYLEAVVKLTADGQSNVSSLVGSAAFPMTVQPVPDVVALEYQIRKFEPKVDGRITCLSDDQSV